MPKSKTSRAKRKRSPTADDVLAQIRDGDYSPAYLFHGPETFDREATLKAVIDAAVDPATRAFNLDIFHAEDVELSDAANCAASYPLMAPRRVVAIKGVDRLQESEAKQLLSTVSSVPETTVLVLTADRLDRRKKVFSALHRAAFSVEFRQPYDRKISEWVRKRVETAGNRIEPEAAHLLHVSVGTHLWDLANELEKLYVNVDEGGTITRRDVEWIVGGSEEATVFQLADAVGRRQIGRATVMLKQLLDHGEAPPRIVGFLTRHVTILRKAAWIQNQRLPRRELAGRLGVPPFFLPNYLEQAARFDDQSLWDAYDALLEADDRLKSRSRTPFVTLSRMIYRICSEKSAARDRGFRH